MSPVFSHPIYGSVILLAVFFVFNSVIERLTHLPAAAFFSGSLLWAFLSTLGWLKAGLLLGAAVTLAVFGRPLAKWSDLEYSGPIRAFVLVLIAAVAWPLLTAGYNYYFDQAYLLDKALLLAAIALVWWRPVFVYVFSGLAYLLLWQLAEPSLGGSILPHKLQLLRAINVFGAAFLVFSFTGRPVTRPFLILLCSFVAAAYWVPALAKFSIAWLSQNNLLLAPLSAYAHGWLSFLPADRIVELARALTPLNPVFKLFVFLIEGLCIVFLFRRWLSIVLLGSLIIFHLGVFAMYGFLFWTWIVLDLALLLLILAVTSQDRESLYNGRSLGMSIVLIAFAAWWAKPPHLGWYDTSLTYSYRIVAHYAHGGESQIHPRYFAPYDDVFTMASFSYLVPGRSVLTGPYGVTHDHAVHSALIRAGSAPEVFEIERNLVRSNYSAERAERLKYFLTRFVANREAHGESKGMPRALRAPPQFWSSRGVWPSGEIAHLTVLEVTEFFDGERLRPIRAQEVLRVPLSDAEGA